MAKLDQPIYIYLIFAIIFQKISIKTYHINPFCYIQKLSFLAYFCSLYR